MSYDLCKRITLDKKNNKIKVCVASNNITPKTYETCEYCKNYEGYSFEDKLLCLYEDMQSGNIQISTINDNTENFEYAMWKVREYLRENNIDSYEDLYIRKGILYREKIFNFAGIKRSTLEKESSREYEDWKTYKEWKDKQDKNFVKKMEDKFEKEIRYKVYGNCFEIFKKALYEKIEGSYKVLYANVYPIVKVGKYDRGYSRFSYSWDTETNICLKCSYKKAYIITKDFGSKRELKIVKVGSEV